MLRVKFANSTERIFIVIIILYYLGQVVINKLYTCKSQNIITYYKITNSALEIANIYRTTYLSVTTIIGSLLSNSLSTILTFTSKTYQNIVANNALKLLLLSTINKIQSYITSLFIEKPIAKQIKVRLVDNQNIHNLFTAFIYTIKKYFITYNYNSKDLQSKVLTFILSKLNIQHLTIKYT